VPNIHLRTLQVMRGQSIVVLSVALCWSEVAACCGGTPTQGGLFCPTVNGNCAVEVVNGVCICPNLDTYCVSVCYDFRPPPGPPPPPPTNPAPYSPGSNSSDDGTVPTWVQLTIIFVVFFSCVGGCVWGCVWICYKRRSAARTGVSAGDVENYENGDEPLIELAAV
jgi:hypothetical protein